MAESRQPEISEDKAPASPKLERSVSVSFFTKPPLSRSPSSHVREDYLPPPKPEKRSNSGTRIGLPHKWRPMSDYELCSKETLVKLGIVKPDATNNSFDLYIKKADRDKENPTIYFIKFNAPGSYLSEFEAFFAALYNFMEPGIIQSAHVIFNDHTADYPPIAVCTVFDKSFIPVKKKAITEADLKDPEVVKCLATIIALAQLLEECDLHGNNFVWADSLRLKRVDVGQSLWNYLLHNPKTEYELRSFVKRYLWGTPEDIFPLTVEEFESSPNFKCASPRYCPGGSGKKSIFSDGSSYMTWFSKNAFTPQELEVYRNPKNLQKNSDFNYIKFKLATLFTFLSPDVIQEIGRLYLRTTEGPKDKPVKLTHIEDVAKHLDERIKQCRDTLVQSTEYKSFIKSSLSRAMRDICTNIDAFNDKIDKKMRKHPTSTAYAGLFACKNPENPKASMTIDAIKAKRAELDREALKL